VPGRYRDSEQELRNGLHMEAGGPKSGDGPRAAGRLDSDEVVDREPYELLFGERKALGGTPSGRSPTSGRRPPTTTPNCWPLNPRYRGTQAGTETGYHPPGPPEPAPIAYVSKNENLLIAL
jgi:hypothetical protein